MTMTKKLPADPAGRLVKWRAARKRVNAGDIVAAKAMAATLGMTWQQVTMDIKDADKAGNPIPIVERGGMGKSYTFDPAAVLDWYIAREQAKADTRASEAAKLARLAGFDSGIERDGSTVAGPGEPPSSGPVSPADLKRIAETQMLAHKLKMAQGQYVLADEVRALLNDLMTTMQVETLAIAPRLDPAGQWSPELRVSVEDGLRSVLVTVQGRLEDWLKHHVAKSRG